MEPPIDPPQLFDNPPKPLLLYLTTPCHSSQGTQRIDRGKRELPHRIVGANIFRITSISMVRDAAQRFNLRSHQHPGRCPTAGEGETDLVFWKCKVPIALPSVAKHGPCFFPQRKLRGGGHRRGRPCQQQQENCDRETEDGIARGSRMRREPWMGHDGRRRRGRGIGLGLSYACGAWW